MSGCVVIPGSSRDEKRFQKREGKSHFEHACSQVPDCDIELFRQHSDIQSEDEIREIIAHMAYENRCCSSCGAGKSQSKELKRCSGCDLVFYCNEECQKKHLPEHTKRCGRPHKKDVPLDQGYMALVFPKIVSPDDYDEHVNLFSLNDQEFDLLYRKCLKIKLKQKKKKQQHRKKKKPICMNLNGVQLEVRMESETSDWTGMKEIHLVQSDGGVMEIVPKSRLIRMRQPVLK